MTEIKLYEHPISGNCYKIRLLLSMLGCVYRRVPADFLKGETQTPEFLKLNPRGQIPLLVDGETVVWDSLAILVYLARRYGDDRWLATDAVGESRVMQWLAVSENELLYGLARARAIKRLNRPFNLEQCQKEGGAGLNAMEVRLQDNDWLAGENATIADIACYPYVLLAPEGEVSLQPYPAVRAWLDRIQKLPGWVPMA
ncbi:MAG: glutathione S-transferase family protein [Pseudomonadota bacterium]